MSRAVLGSLYLTGIGRSQPTLARACIYRLNSMGSHRVFAYVQAQAWPYRLRAYIQGCSPRSRGRPYTVYTGLCIGPVHRQIPVYTGLYSG